MFPLSTVTDVFVCLIEQKFSQCVTGVEMSAAYLYDSETVYSSRNRSKAIQQSIFIFYRTIYFPLYSSCSINTMPKTKEHPDVFLIANRIGVSVDNFDCGLDSKENIYYLQTFPDTLSIFL